ncbi:MAG: cupin domain-containing protein, partial [Deltaproteobacteria bacterium]|nr:cupin domain-containing protein [Deltaproteobacteria bacterium]
YVLQGRAMETVGDEKREIGPGSAVFIPPEVEHKFDNLGDEMLILLVVVSPPGVVEENLYETQVKSAKQSWDIEYF